MLAVIAETLPIAFGIILATLPIIAVPLFLLGAGKGRELAGFLVGWGAGFLILGGIVLVAAASLPGATDEPRLWMNRIRLVLGLLLLALAGKYWRGRPRGGEAPPVPGWIAALETLTLRRAAGLGFLMAAANPKNALLIASGAMGIAAATPLPAARIGALVVFCVISSLGIAAPAIAWAILGERVARPLDRMKVAMVRHNNVILATVLLVLGLFVTAKSFPLL